MKADRLEMTTYVDQVLVDEATLGPGRTPRVETFSTKQRDFTRMDESAIKATGEADGQEAVLKYGETITIRRRGHVLYNQKVRVTKVHLVYDESLLPKGGLARKWLEEAAAKKGVEVHWK